MGAGEKSLEDEKKRFEDEEKAIRELFGPDMIEALELVRDIREKREELRERTFGRVETP
jgi:hypothetical protein